MKKLKRVALLLLLLALGIVLTACISSEISRDFVTFTVNWGGEDGEISYRGLTHHEDYGWIYSRDFYTLDGVYTLPGGRGEKVFDALGNLVVDDFNDGDTYYAYWKPINIFLSFELPTGCTFEDGTSRKEVAVEYTGQLPQTFPIATDELGAELACWHTSTVNEQPKAYTAVTDANGILLEGKEKVADYCTVPPTKNVPYVIVFAPYESYDGPMGGVGGGDNICDVKLNFGDGTVIRLEYGVRDDVRAEHLWSGDIPGREFLGWVKYPTERADFVTEIENITEDVTLYAVWRPYREVQLHLINGKVKTIRVYEDEPTLLSEAAALVGTEFVNWYEDSNFNTVASRIVTYEGNVSHYYAKFEPKAELDADSCVLTLHYGNDVIERFEIKAGQSIENCLLYPESGGFELVAWTNLQGEPVTGGTITRNTTLFSAQKAYKDVTLHMYGNQTMTVRIYEGNIYRLYGLPDANGVKFQDWYLDTGFEDRAPDSITYANAVEHYYAQYSNEVD